MPFSRLTGRGLSIGWTLLLVVCTLPAPAQSIDVVPIGDSITQGANGYNAFRRPLWQHFQNGGYNVNMVGSWNPVYPNATPPNADYDRDHEGHWGWRTDEILGGCNGCPSNSGSGQLSTWLQSYTPDVALVHLGTNDLFQCQSVSSTVSEVKQVIDQLRADNPTVVILLAKLIPSTWSICGGTPANTRINEFNGLVPGIAAEKSTAHSPVAVVDLYSGFDAGADTWDGVHPNASGEAKMAQKFYDAFRAVWDNRFSLNLDAYLSCAYNGAGMHTTLADAGHLPGTQPYAHTDYNGSTRDYNGGEQVSTGLFGPADIVDWVLVELRTGTAPGTEVTTRAALLKSNGRIVDLDGQSDVYFNNVAPGNYYVVIRHRNHMSVMSETPVNVSGGSGSYNFITNPGYGILAQNEVTPGQYGLWGGDGNLTENVTALDFLDAWLPINGSSGYLLGDFNMDGTGSSFDFLNVWLPANGLESQVPD